MSNPLGIDRRGTLPPSMPFEISSPWAMDVVNVCAELKTSLRGLSREEAKHRRLQVGRNDVETEHVVPAWEIFLRQFTSPLVLVLIAASVISAVLGEATETIIIILLVCMGGVLAFLQEYRSERSLRLLRKKLTRRATVLRDGVSHRIGASDLTIGDIVELKLGSVVPADLRLVTIEDLEIDESVITGESMPVMKTLAPISRESRLPQEQVNMAFSGTHVVQGSGLGVVVRIGTHTDVGRTAALLGSGAEETEFQKGIRQFGNFLLRITLGLAIIVTLILGLLRGNWGESVLFALALAVGISPELLPVIVTISLTRGAIAMSKKLVLVKRLIAIEDLGNADVFCTDKTGTLTIGKLRARDGIDPDGTPTDAPLALAILCLETDRNGRASNPIDQAIAEQAESGTIAPALPGAVREDIVSFDFERRRMSCVMHEQGTDERCMIVKGAVDEVVALCTTRAIGTSGTAHALHEADRKTILAMTERFEDQGYRLVAVARRQIEKRAEYGAKDEQGLELVGFVLVSDAPKETARESLEQLEALSVRIVILTGDNERVTRHVAQELHFEIKGLVSGDELERMSDDDLHHVVERTNVFVRITPEHKLRVIEAFKKNGHTVGFMGDGVNDTPALRAADVGISFEEAVDVAKEAASVILLKKKLSVLADGIREGRRTFVTMRTYINATISSNFGNMLSVAGASLLLPFIPLLPAQILLLNLLSDAPMLAISTDRVPEEDVRTPKKWNIAQISNVMYFFGAISSFADYATFSLLLFVAHADVASFRSSWFVESVLTEIIVIYILRTRRLSVEHRPSTALIVAGVATFIVSVALVQTGVGSAFGFMPLPPWMLLSVLAIVIGYGVVTELGKRVYTRFRPMD